MTLLVPGSAELRAEIARRQIHIYILAARVGVHPGRLGMVLRGKLPLSNTLAARVLKALDVADD